MGEIFEHVMPSAPLAWTGERLTTAVGGLIEIEHLHRYTAARDFCRNLDVLDVASGEGYGTALLAQVARSAVGVEIATDAVEHATHQYGAHNLRYLQGDARQIPLSDGSVDVVVSFETVEHFYEQEQFMQEVRRVLRTDGLCIISSPDRDHYSSADDEANPFHKREMSRSEFTELLQTTFPYVRMLCQRTLLGSVLMADDGSPAPLITIERRGAHLFERSQGVSRPPYLIAFASSSEEALTSVPNSLFVAEGQIGPILNRAIDHAPVKVALAEAVARAEAAESAFKSSRAEIAQFADEAQAAMKAARIPAEARIAALEAENESALADLKQAAAYRDAARLAMHRTQTNANARILVLQDQIEHLRVQLQASQASGEAWHARYLGLRGRIESLLRRSGLLKASRLLPRPIRHSVRDRLFSRSDA